MAIDSQTRSAVITVERTEVLKTGETKGRPWTLYQVHGHFGTPEEVGARLVAHKSFDSMPTGVVKVTCEPDREEFWTMLKLAERPPRNRTERPSGGDAKVIAELQSRVAKLERQMAAILTNAEIDLP